MPEIAMDKKMQFIADWWRVCQFQFLPYRIWMQITERHSVFWDEKHMCRKLHMSDMISGCRPDDASEAFIQPRRSFVLMQRNPVVILSLLRESLHFNGRQDSRAMVMFGSDPICWAGLGLPLQGRVTFMWEFSTIPLANRPIWGVLAPG